MHYATQVTDLNSTVVKIDASPIAVAETTPLTKIHFIFTITGWDVLFVTHKGKFKGIIGKNDIAVQSTTHHTSAGNSPATH